MLCKHRKVSRYDFTHYKSQFTWDITLYIINTQHNYVIVYVDMTYVQ